MEKNDDSFDDDVEDPLTKQLTKWPINCSDSFFHSKELLEFFGSSKYTNNNNNNSPVQL